MSWNFDGTTDRCSGAFADGPYDTPCSLAVMAKYVTHPLNIDSLLMVGSSGISNATSLRIATNNSADGWNGSGFTATSTASNCIVNYTPDSSTNFWVPIVMTSEITGNGRDVYVGNVANTLHDGLDRDMLNSLVNVKIGQNFVGAQDFLGKLAEPAFWTVELNTTMVDKYLSFIPANQITAAVDLKGYWPLATNSLLNLGSDSGGDLTAFGNAAFDATLDHPPMQGGTSAPRRRGGLPGRPVEIGRWGGQVFKTHYRFRRFRGFWRPAF